MSPPAKRISTKFGIASISDWGYYRITSTKEGNWRKYLHRLIFEDFHGIKIPDGYVIHHKNGNKLDNSIENLEMMESRKHNSMHMIGENNPFYGKQGINYGKKLSEETCKRMSENHADVNGENNPKWGTSEIEEWGGLWFLKEMKLQLKTVKKVTEFTGLTDSMIHAYLRRRGFKWSTLHEQYQGDVHG